MCIRDRYKILEVHRRAIIAEYIKPAEAFANEYDSFGNVLRLVMLHEPGESPQIGEAFLRIDAHYIDNAELLERNIEAVYGIEVSYLKREKD